MNLPDLKDRLSLDATRFEEIRAKEMKPSHDITAMKLLREKAGKERDLRELYRQRAPYELLQNADDARATRAVFILLRDGLVFAHNGNWFTVSNFRSLADGWSDKDPTQCIGHKGLGFRSVLDITPSPYLIYLSSIPTGEQRNVDLIAQVLTLDGVPELILIHLEVQSERRGNFPARMSEYYMLLRLRRRLPVMPIVVYLVPGAGGLTQETHTETVFDRTVLRFEYEAVGVPDLEAEDYLKLDNPLAPALSALMRPGPTGRLAQKLQALRRVLLSGVDDARKSLLINIIQMYSPVSLADEAGLMAQIEQETRQEVEALLLTWEDSVIARGKRDTLLRQLRHKFGELPEDLKARIKSIETVDELDILLDRLLDARSLDEVSLP